MSKPAEQCAVLVVEDDPAIRRLVRMIVERNGYQVETAADGVEAVLKLGLADYDAVILDLMMPNLDGFTFIETMEQHDPERLRRIIVMSAASPSMIRERLGGKPFAVVPKPFDMGQLMTVVRECVEQQ